MKNQTVGKILATPERTKLYQAKNDSTKMKVCVCLLSKAWRNTPKDDVVTLCFGKMDKKGLPKHTFLMTPNEANDLGEALIGATWFYLGKREKVSSKEVKA